jgi:uncharacterized protein YndB with AHSA1/START domain
MTENTYDVRAERTLNASPEDVFDAYTNPVAGRTIFTGGPGWTVEVTCDLRVGGLWTILSGAEGTAPVQEVNRFTKIERPTYLAFTSTLVIPGGPTLNRRVEVTFRQKEGDRTVMTITQGGFPTPELRDAFVAGLANVFDGLDRVAVQSEDARAAR